MKQAQKNKPTWPVSLNGNKNITWLLQRSYLKCAFLPEQGSPMEGKVRQD